MNNDHSNEHHSHEQEYELRRAVEEQLDLILKMEAERKALRKQNKTLSLQLKNAAAILAKYQVQTTNSSTNTEEFAQKRIQQIASSSQPAPAVSKIRQIDQCIQVDSEGSCPKLMEAQSLLMELDCSRAMGGSKIEESGEAKTAAKKVQTNSKQISSEIVKMTKQINSLKRELKEAHQKHSAKDKEIRDLKKCLDTKNEALEKARKDFNELSLLMNTDKYKSVRQLETEIMSLKAKVGRQQEGTKLKRVLEGLTQEYEQYKREMETKLDILVSELAAKEKQNEQLANERKILARRIEELN